ncbi:structure-specific endonuclease subunit slx1-like [Ruditapes philippinarum]|uniref:structure-specific endonuclease subunit slx1-like n=1 Tax=Ruditapes philippinarum TaxID=129788 RepID=UPI00295C1F21|nr:structure-specific endonuclease subunit slx1-like [Ruditapes philippinarum]XP_060561918.1 structure-specific endonuclease subunit slx1-like [Ruditapes philippinarum]
MVHEIENFYGVYLLYNVNPKFKGRTYIGYTVDPNRRIKQHNQGVQAGGAYRTSGKGPWEMVLIIHGFPNDISGLRFEWAWQHPEKSRRLKHLTRKTKKEKQFEYRFRIVSEMLRTAPWNRLALTIRWLKQEFVREFDPKLTPPLHMAVAYGPVKSKKVKNIKATETKGGNTDSGEDIDADIIAAPVSKHTRCAVCMKLIMSDSQSVSCYRPKCSMISHMTCLAKSFLTKKQEEKTHILPVDGACPRCSQQLLWGDIIRHKHGCYQTLTEVTEEEDSDDDHWANELQTQVT